MLRQSKNLLRQEFVYALINLSRDIEKSYRDMISESHVCYFLRHKEIMSQQTLSL